MIQGRIELRKVDKRLMPKWEVGGIDDGLASCLLLHALEQDMWSLAQICVLEKFRDSLRQWAMGNDHSH